MAHAISLYAAIHGSLSKTGRTGTSKLGLPHCTNSNPNSNPILKLRTLTLA